MELPPSKLGTKKYWEDFYNVEIDNFKDNAQDTGECWFSDSGAEQRMIEFIEELGPSHSILDLGTGNGRLLFSLRDADIEGDFLGVDYVQSSVDFATQVAAAEDYDVQFQRVDILSDNGWTDKQFDIVTDKGTLDAIALSGHTYGEGSPAQLYIEKVKPLVRPGGTLLITSCNFTEKELSEIVGLPYDSIEYPTFSFGGQNGSTVVSLAFKA